MGDDAETRRLLAALRGIAEQETARLRDGTLPWTWWLERAARYGRYGFTNTLLISAQWRAATDVRSYEAWRAAGRQVRKGEAAIRLITPDGRVGAVFDVAQTDGLPLQDRPPADGREHLHRVAARLGYQRDEDLAVLAHQLAHVLRRGDRPDPPGLAGCHGLRRVEADSVAYLVLAGLGLEPPRLSFPPVAGWAGPELGDRVLRLSRRLRHHDRSAEVMRAAHRFFRACLDGSWVPDYLVERGFSRAVQRRWQIGYAPRDGQALAARLRSLGHSDEELVSAGLARRSRSGALYDTFRDRAMFALRTPEGAVTGFIGRLPDGAEGPKYLNGPDTEHFHKNESLYGLHETRDRLARGARPVLVEGPLDAIAVNVAAARTHAAVATCGASVTAAQLGSLSQIADLDLAGLVVALDDDEAGRSGSLRAWHTLTDDARVRGPIGVVSFGSGQDAAGLLRSHGRAAVRAALRTEKELSHLVLDAAIERSGGALSTHEQRLTAVRAAVRVIASTAAAPVGGAAAAMPDVAREVAHVAARTGVRHGTVTEILAETVSPRGDDGADVR
ncbi:toprim domain-containing protein [Actinomadura fulvescens]|uniref:DNA primase DNAG catalytic core N-terminal domain-containing protein n=1 Tax=Actinomadura fulvescens TaxID=46160 RepID=A0ABP6C6W2_9ACTN